MPLEIFVFEDPAADAFGTVHGVMLRVTNPTAAAVAYEVHAPGMEEGLLGPVYAAGWQADSGRAHDTLAPLQSRLWLLEYTRTEAMHQFQLEVRAAGALFAWEQQLPNAAGQPIEPGMEVTTYTVGVWVNGTSFYTNIAAFNEDPLFPAGYDRQAFEGSALSVYVYDQDRSEQPNRSRENCHRTTIPGYNELLKSQTAGGTGVRFLAPEEGYTRPGNEDHFLFGEPLVFLNRVASVATRGLYLADPPDPQADCFDANWYAPDPIPDIPPQR